MDPNQEAAPEAEAIANEVITGLEAITRQLAEKAVATGTEAAVVQALENTGYPDITRTLSNMASSKVATWRPMVSTEGMERYLEDDVEDEGNIRDQQDMLELQNRAARLQRFRQANAGNDPYRMLDMKREVAMENAQGMQMRSAGVGAGVGALSAATAAGALTRRPGPMIMAGLAGAVGGGLGGGAYGSRYPGETADFYNELEDYVSKHAVTMTNTRRGLVYGRKAVRGAKSMLKRAPAPGKKAVEVTTEVAKKGINPAVLIGGGLVGGGAIGVAAADIADGPERTKRHTKRAAIDFTNPDDRPSYLRSAINGMAIPAPMGVTAVAGAGFRGYKNHDLDERRRHGDPSYKEDALKDQINSSANTHGLGGEFLGGVIGGVAGGLPGALAGNIRASTTGAAVGLLAGGGLGFYAARKRRAETLRGRFAPKVASLIDELAPKEATYLKGVLAEAEAYLAARRSGEKVASGRFADMEATLEKTASLNNLFQGRTLAALALGIPTGLAIANTIGSKIMDPFIEESRFKSMMALDGDPIQVQGHAADGLFIDRSLEDEERKQQAIRKAFDLINQYAPEATRTPEVARGMTSQLVNSNPQMIVERARQWAEGDVNLAGARSKLRSGLTDMFKVQVKDIAGLYDSKSFGLDT